MSKILQGRRALVTGASRGIGAAVARVLSAAGAEVGLVARTRKDLEEVASQLSGTSYLITEDLSTAKGAEKVAAQALEAASSWHILVNNAGVAHQANLLNENAEAWDSLFGLNLRAPMLLSKLLAPGMIEAGGGKIVNVSSLAAFVGTPGLAAYAASKAGLNQLTRSMAVEWGPHNIQVNSVCPTIILTEMGREFWDQPEVAELRRSKESRIPLHRFGTAEEVAQAVLFFAGPGSDFINGTALPIDGGVLVAS